MLLAFLMPTPTAGAHAEGLRLDGQSLWMACDRNDGDHRRSLPAFDFIGTVMPEDAVGAGGVVLRVRLEDLLAVDSRQRGELVRVKAWMVRVDFEEAESLANLREERGSGRRFSQRRQLRICRGRKLDLSLHI